MVGDDDEGFGCLGLLLDEKLGNGGLGTYDTENHCSCSSWRCVCDDESVDNCYSKDGLDQGELDNVDPGHEGRHFEVGCWVEIESQEELKCLFV